MPYQTNHEETIYCFDYRSSTDYGISCLESGFLDIIYRNHKCGCVIWNMSDYSYVISQNIKF